MRLKDYRYLRKLTREEFGKEVGVTGIQVWRWETGRNMPKGQMMTKIYQATHGAVGAADHQEAYQEFRDGAAA